MCGVYIKWPNQFQLWNVPTLYGRSWRSSLCANMLHIDSHRVCFKSCTDEWSTYSNSVTYTLRVKTCLLRCWSNQKRLSCERWSTAIRWVKKCRLNYKNSDVQVRSCWPKNMDSETLIQSTKANPVSTIWRVSNGIRISESNVVHNLGKSIWCCLIVLHFTKYCMILTHSTRYSDVMWHRIEPS